LYISLRATTGRPTTYAKRKEAEFMLIKGNEFLKAALLLQREGGYESVVLHLYCQGIEIFLKALLLLKNYDKYKPKLGGKSKRGKYGQDLEGGKYGHDLEMLVSDVLKEFALNPLRPELAKELETLNRLYKHHLLRYSSLYDFFFDPRTIACDRVFRRLAAALRLSYKHLGRL
jgi:hypothetical protein